MIEYDSLIQGMAGAFSKGFSDPLPDPFGEEEIQETRSIFDDENDDIEWEDPDYKEWEKAPEGPPPTSKGFPAQVRAAERKTWTKAFENGNIPLKEMEQVAPGQFLRKDVGQAHRAMERAARKDGVDLSIVSAYRTRDQQAVLYAKYKSGAGNLAAEPGKSDHGWGTTIDYGSGGWNWLKRNAKRFGFEATVPGEPWHYEFNGRYKAKVDARGKPRKKKGAAPVVQQQAVPNILQGEAPAFSATVMIPGMMFDLLSESPRKKKRGKKPERGGGGGGGVPDFIPNKVRPLIARAAKQTGVSARLIAYTMWMENSGGSAAPNKTKFTHNVTSSAGAIGYMQVMPFWAKTLGLNLRDPAQNVLAGAMVLARNLKSSKGNIRNALAMYYSGSADAEGLWYANKVLREMRG